jgi:hypothetical protein
MAMQRSFRMQQIHLRLLEILDRSMKEWQIMNRQQ